MTRNLYACEQCGTEFEQRDDCHWFCDLCWIEEKLGEEE